MFFVPSYVFFVIRIFFRGKLECALQVVVAVLIKEKCNPPRELGRGRLSPFVPAFRL